RDRGGRVDLEQCQVTHEFQQPTGTRSIQQLRAQGDAARIAARQLADGHGPRLGHSSRRLRHGEVPIDLIDSKALNPRARSYLKEAFRAVASVQSGLAAELAMGIRWAEPL